ncbi:MAG: diguanylate cyclase [Deltaproteobacteria bacterium]|nr:diguanylate cyclase [Deltaproteobacteria bacterium]
MAARPNILVVAHGPPLSPTPVKGTALVSAAETPQSVRILILDDDRSVRQLLGHMITDCGYEPLVASTWAEALRMYREASPHLILLDVMMPGMDGYKVAKMFRDQGGAFVPIILLTALEDLESKRRGMAAGADDFLTKPVSQLELQIRLSSMLRIKVLTDQLERANAQLAELAVTDPLTGLHNRRHLFQEMDREFARAQRYKRPLACYMIDIDHFKQVNDTYGHQIGDRVLVLMAEVIMGSVRNTDIAGRFGGEEFMILAPETPTAAGMVLAERVRHRVPARTAAEQPDVPRVTVSIGLATTEHPQASDPTELVRLADEALYRAKDGGRDRVVAAST